MDNKKLVQNIIAWLIEPSKEPKVMTFILNQLGDLQYEIRETNKVINNLIETMTILEKRISYIEENTQLFPDSTNLENSSEEESLQQ